jgi:hypothetical protein
VAKGGVLELELRHAPPSGEHCDHADEHEVAEGSQGARMLPTSVNQSGIEFGAPQDCVPFRHVGSCRACDGGLTPGRTRRGCGLPSILGTHMFRMATGAPWTIRSRTPQRATMDPSHRCNSPRAIEFLYPTGHSVTAP